jgi:hypothetical protein
MDCGNQFFVPLVLLMASHTLIVVLVQELVFFVLFFLLDAGRLLAG